MHPTGTPGATYSPCMSFTEVIELVGKVIEAAGVGAIIVGAIVAAVLAVSPAKRRAAGGGHVYADFRRRLGRAILLGLELLVAADIIRTVAISPSFESAGVLALIVFIRTFLSWSLELEISGRWPWQKHRAGDPADPGPGSEPARRGGL